MVFFFGVQCAPCFSISVEEVFKYFDISVYLSLFTFVYENQNATLECYRNMWWIIA